MIPNRVGRLTAKLRRRIVQAERQGGEVSLKGIRRRCQGQGEAIGRVERNGADAMPAIPGENHTVMVGSAVSALRVRRIGATHANLGP